MFKPGYVTDAEHIAPDGEVCSWKAAAQNIMTSVLTSTVLSAAAGLCPEILAVVPLIGAKVHKQLALRKVNLAAGERLLDHGNSFNVKRIVSEQELSGHFKQLCG